MEYYDLSLNITKEFSKLSSIFTKVVEIQTILNNLRRHLTVFPSDFNSICLKYFCILQNLTIFYEILRDFMRFYKSLRKFTKVYKSWRKLWYSMIFFGQIPCFHSVSFNYDVLFAFRNFVPWWMKFFCLLLYSFASWQYRQIFHHRQTIGDISNIADT